MENNLLKQSELIEIFENKIKPKLLKHLKSELKPKCVFLAGQPGAGKTNLADVTITELKNNALVIDIDELRKMHPNLSKVKDQYDLDIDTRQWKTMLIDECIKQKYNIVFDGTLGGNMKYIEPEMKKLKDNNFTVKINALSVNDSVSKLGFISRYEEQLARTGKGRHVDLSFHNDIYKNIPNNLTEAIGKGLIEEMNLYKKNHATKETTLLKTFTKETFKSAKDLPIYEFDKERIRPLSQEEIKSLKTWYTNTIDNAINNKSDISKIESILISDDNKSSIELKNQIEEFKNIREIIPNIELKYAILKNEGITAYNAVKNGADVTSIKAEYFNGLTVMQEKSLKIEIQRGLIDRNNKNDDLAYGKGKSI